MDKKSMVVAIMLSFLAAPAGLSPARLLTGRLLYIFTIVQAGRLPQGSPSAAIVGNLIACFITYKWVQEYNNGVDGGGAED